MQNLNYIKQSNNHSFKLHCAARRYCIDQWSYWWESSKMLDKNISDYNDQLSYVSARCDALDEILYMVEKIDADKLPDFNDLLQQLTDEAKTMFINSRSSKIELKAIDDTRIRFCNYLESLTKEVLLNIEDLPYRHVIEDQEAILIWRKINSLWGTNNSDGNYYPLLKEKTDPSLFAFEAEGFHKKFSDQELHEILSNLGVRRAYELREFGNENYYLSVEMIKPYYNGLEGFWICQNFDWILYASHHGTITTGGRLTETILKLWPDAKEFSL